MFAVSLVWLAQVFVDTVTDLIRPGRRTILIKYVGDNNKRHTASVVD